MTGMNGQQRTNWTPMFFISLGVALIIMDATIVTVILPSIVADLGIDSVTAEWVNAVYSLTFASLLIVMGRLGDRFGRKRIFWLGAIVFAASSLMAAASTSGAMLIGARALQGVGGAMMSPTSLSIVNALYRGRTRAIAFAIYGSIIGGMAAVGPVVGGWLTETFSWHWSFWVNLPIAALILLGAARYVPESKAEGDTGAPDLVGAFLSTLTIAALVFALIEGRNYGWVTATQDASLLGVSWSAGALSPVAVAFAIAAIGLPVLVRFESGRVARGQVALIDTSLLRLRSFGLGSFAGLIVSLGEFGLLFSLPLFLQSVLGWSAIGSGALLAALALGTFTSAPTAAKLANSRSPRFVTRLGLVLEIAGILAISLLASPTASGWVLGGGLFVYGCGVGYATAQLTGLILADVPVAKSGQASGMQSAARQLGAAMGTAVLGTIIFEQLRDRTAALVGRVPGVTADAATAIADGVEKSAGTVIPRLAAETSVQVQAAAQQAFAEALRATGLAAAAFLVLGLVATLFLPSGAHVTDESELVRDFE